MIKIKFYGAKMDEMMKLWIFTVFSGTVSAFIFLYLSEFYPI